ncbi:protein kinase [Nonomuraea sp. NPDC049419]|uniref:serine/threonine-protein kinase n=1 Tax=Nonomuraea sp. NPDC049419 TaxID=3155772 RepID=UPI0034171CBE
MQKRVIDGRFELVERLGGGGMGLVWRAWDVALHREVALKEVRPPDPTIDEHDPTHARELRARVLREARALAQLNHPHVVTIHHIVDPGEQGYPWIVMELVTGGSLQDRIQSGPVHPAEAARTGREVLSALRAAHAVGIHHRDVKPANVLLHADGRSVLTDFGIAAMRESTSLTSTGAFIGSPEYMAPERINGVEGDPASDLWSLGMMLYVAVEGRHPLRRSTALATLAAVLNQEVPPPVRAGALTPVLTALLARDPAARPDAETLDRMLAVAMDPNAAPPPPPVMQAPRPPGPSHTVPPGYPQPWSGGPVPHADTLNPRPKRGGRGAAIAVSLSAVVVAGVLVWRLLPSTPDETVPDPEPSHLAMTATPSRTPTTPRVTIPSLTPSTKQPVREKLLTPDGIRAMLRVVKPVIGTSKVVGMSVHETHASLDVPLKRDKKVYNTYDYRDGQVDEPRIGGQVKASPADLDTFNWDRLPALFKRADKDLGVPEPTSRYIIVDTDYGFTSVNPVLLVYVSDDYHRTGYLVASPQGKVLKLIRNE